MNIFIHNILLALIYIASAKICQNFAIEPGNITPIWLASGICFIWVFIKGYKLLPGVFVGAFFGNVLAYPNEFLSQHMTKAFIAGTFNAIGDIVCIWIGVYFLKKISYPESILGNVKKTAVFIVISGLGGALISGIFGVGGLFSVGLVPKENLLYAFSTWVIGDALGIIILVPLLENIFLSKDLRLKEINKYRLLELLFFSLCMILSILFVLENNTEFNIMHFMPLFVFMPFLGVLVYRYSEFLINIFIVLFCICTLYIVIGKVGHPYSNLDLNSALLFIQFYIFSVSTTLYLLRSSINHNEYLNNQILHKERLATLGEMAAAMGHEINNPISIIKVANKQLYKNIENPKRLLELQQTVENATDRVSKIMDGLKKYAYNKEDLELKEVSVEKVIKESIDFIQLQHNLNHIYLEIEFQEDFKIHIDEVLISQVILNLLNNSIDALKDVDRPWIGVSTKLEKGRGIIKICDSGNTNMPKKLEELFNPFYTSKKRGKGTGLGLSISKRIMHDHRGDIGVYKENNLTCFWLSFPILDH